MRGKKILKALGFIIITAIFGYLGFYLKTSVESGLLFLENNDSLLAESIIIIAPFVLCIILGWICRRKIWILSLLTILACTGVNAVLGEATTPRHVPLFVVCLAIPYILCLFAIFSSGNDYVPSSHYSSSYDNTTYSGSSSSSSDYDPSLGVNTYMTVWGTNEPVYYKDGEYVDRHGNHVSITDIDD